MAMSRNTQHNAPAGQKYSSIRDAGEKTLATYCQRFPQSPTRQSFILPILFKSSHPENVRDDAVLSEADRWSRTGLNINIRGERGEYELYKAFYTIVHRSPIESILVLHGYKLDNDNGRSLKNYAIINELPTIDLSGVNMEKEHDFIVVVRYVGKLLASAKNIASAESQLYNSETFVQQIFTAIAGATSPQLPIVKVIVIPQVCSTLSSPRKNKDCHIVYKNNFQNFASTWTQIVYELKISPQTSTISPNCFENLVQFLVGVWLMKPITKNTYDFNNDHALLSTDVTAIDSAVKRAGFAPSKQAQKLTNDIRTSLNKVFQRVDEINIMYLSPKQKALYDNYKHSLILSHAGAGKTMLILFKIIELLESHSTQKVLLVAPKPHHLRLQQILNKNDITTDIATKFPYMKQQRTSTSQAPPTPLPTCDVFIITLQDFFEVPRKTLTEYDVFRFNVFVDDMHSYEVPNDDTGSRSDGSISGSDSDSESNSTDGQESNSDSDIDGGNSGDSDIDGSNISDGTDSNGSLSRDGSDSGGSDCSNIDIVESYSNNGDEKSRGGHDTINNGSKNDICTFTDIGDFVDKTYNLLKSTKQYAWFAFDVVQQTEYYIDDEAYRRSDRMFRTSDGSSRTFSIPVVTMTNVLRCTKEITDVVDTARQQQMKHTEVDTNHVIRNMGCGHHITTGTRVLYEKLQYKTDKKHWIPFVCGRVCALLRNLTITTSQKADSFPFSTVAILFYDDYAIQDYKHSLQSMMRQQFNVGVQSIEQQILSNNDDIIIDHSGNVQSFESPTVVYVRIAYGGYSNQAMYNLLSRARTQCVVIDVDTYNPPYQLRHIDVVTWKEENGAFQKM